jgi:hypothetical protein
VFIIGAVFTYVYERVRIDAGDDPAFSCECSGNDHHGLIEEPAAKSSDQYLCDFAYKIPWMEPDRIFESQRDSLTRKTASSYTHWPCSEAS